jgi:hypothetical protein
MPIADDWDIDYVNQEIRHVDGILTYANNAGTAPSLNHYIRGGTSGAVARIIGGSDLGGVAAAGTLNLTNVVGRFSNTEALTVLDELPFDTVGGTPQGFAVGESLTGPTTEAFTIRAIEYNQGPNIATPGEGVCYGSIDTAGFANNEQIDNATTTATAVALVNGAEVDRSALFTSATVNGTLAVPGTANTNNSAIIHYDAGAIAIPEDAKVADATTGAFGFAQQVVGVLATGSIRLVDSDTTGGAWTNDNGLELQDVVFYDTQVAGEVFLEGDIIEGATSLERFRVLAVIDDGDSTGKLITAGKTGTLTNLEVLRKILPGDIVGANVANVENLTEVLAAATLNLPNGVRTEQRDTQGGIFGTSVSLNIRRSANAFFSYLVDTFDELLQLNDSPALQGTFLDTVYTLLSSNGWEIPDLSFRFLEKGGFTDAGKNNIWTNDQSIMSRVIAANGFLPVSSAPKPHPNAYIEQAGLVLSQFWLEGDFSVLIKVKTTSDTRYIDAATPALGQLIDSANRTWLLREYGDTFDLFDTAQVGAVAAIPLTTKNDDNNNTGQHRWSFNTGGAGAFTVGEEITDATGLAIGIVTASDSGATGDVDYILKSTQVFQDSDVITGAVSGKSATLDVAGDSTLVAGYSANIRTMVVDRRFTGGTTTVATFIIGEGVTQAVSGATGFVLEDDGGTIYVQDNTGTFDGTNQLSGDTSGALNTPTATAAFTTVPKDLGDGSGDLNYSGVSSADITGASAQPVLSLYEWDKYLTRAEATQLEGGTGATLGVEGRLYRSFASTFAEFKDAPYGQFAGGIMFGAQGHFIDKDTLATVDLQNIRLLDNTGSPLLIPPNLQTYLIGNLQSGWRAGGYRSTGAAAETILTTEFQIGAGNAAGNSTIVVQAGSRGVGPLPSDVPDTGVLRIEDPSNAGIFLRAIYDSVNRGTNTFSLQQGIGQNTIGDITGAVALTQGEDCFVVFIEEESTGATVSNNVQYVADITTVTVARKKGFLDFIAAGDFTSTGQSTNVVRTPDPTVNLP